MRDMLQRNMRGIIVALLGVGLITAVLTASSNEADEPNTQETTSEVTEAEGDTSEGEEQEETSEEGAEPAEGEAMEQADEPDVSDIQSSDDSYSASAVSGESQTSIARRVVDMYVKDLEDGDQFAAEQKLFMETWLVGELGRKDIIHVGDEVSITNDQLETAAEAARNLTSEQIQLWSQYL